MIEGGKCSPKINEFKILNRIILGKLVSNLQTKIEMLLRKIKAQKNAPFCVRWPWKSPNENVTKVIKSNFYFSNPHVEIDFMTICKNDKNTANPKFRQNLDEKRT